jgi:DNA-binding NarL/FixJ family response regulator
MPAQQPGADVVGRYRGGESIRSIAAAVGTSSYKVRAALIGAGVQLRRAAGPQPRRLPAAAAVVQRPLRRPLSPDAARMTQLSERHLAVLRLIAEGATDTGIGNVLGLTRAAVGTDRCKIYRRLRAVNAAHAVSLAYQMGILPGAGGSCREVSGVAVGPDV